MTKEGERPGSPGSEGSGGGSGSDRTGDDGNGVEAAASPPPPIPCVWFAPAASQETADLMNRVTGIIEQLVSLAAAGATIDIDVDYYVEASQLRRWNGIAGQFERMELADCARATEPAVTTGDVRWRVVTEPTPAVLIPGLRLIVSGAIGAPEPQVNPPTEAPVNLGLWFAVADPGPIVAEGRLGPLWARGTATLTETTFDPGNGDRIEVCDGPGTPIANVATVEEGPCGYTYRTHADVDADGLEITIQTTWTIVWETSDGDASADPPETRRRTTAIPYDVYEIQTVGTG